jgi:hypothetical protein
MTDVDGWLASTEFGEVLGCPRESVDGRWGKRMMMSSSMCHAMSTSMCHAMSPKLTPQDDVSCHVNIPCVMSTVATSANRSGRWSMVKSSIWESVFDNHQGSLIIDGSMVGHRPKLLRVPFTNEGRSMMTTDD